MHESHLEPIEARPRSKFVTICQKLRKNLLLTLTVLGECSSTFDSDEKIHSTRSIITHRAMLNIWTGEAQNTTGNS